MKMNRNGRAVIDGEVRDIMLPERDRTFYFTRYGPILLEPPAPASEGITKVICRDAKTKRIERFMSVADEEEKMFWSKAVGFETGSHDRTVGEGEDYRLVKRDFDVLKGVNLVYAHPDLENILAQLGISSLTPFFMADNFGLEATGEKVEMEVQQIKPLTGRTAAFEKPVIINGTPYLLEVKGVNLADRAMDLRVGDWAEGECMGGMTKEGMERSVEMLTLLNSKGYDSSVLLAAYQIPNLRQSDGKELGAYVRAVKCSPTLAHYYEALPEVAEALGMSKEELAEHIIKEAAKDMAKIWKQGITHSWVHEQNIRISGVTDLTGAHYVRDSGFNGVVTNAEMLVATCQRIMRGFLAPRVKIPFRLYETDPEEAERLESLAAEMDFKDQAEHFCRTRGIITAELNKHLGLNLPSVVGTTTLAAEVYDAQRQLGLTNPDDVINIEYIKGYALGSERAALKLEDLKVKEDE
jgi:hypothetical protein